MSGPAHKVTLGIPTGSDGVPGGVWTPLSFSVDGEQEFLDLNDPTRPLALIEGVYAVTAQAQEVSDPHPGKVFAARLSLDAYVNSAQVDSDEVSLDARAHDFAYPMATLPLVFPLDVGGALQLSVRHNADGPLFFGGSLTVVCTPA